MTVPKRQNTKLSSSTATPAPNASSIWIELVAAVKVFEIEERREIAAGHVRPMLFLPLQNLAYCKAPVQYVLLIG